MPTTLLGEFLNLPVQLGTVRKLRHRLNLKKATVLVRKVGPVIEGQFELSDSRRKPIWRGVLVNSRGKVIFPSAK